MLVTLDTSQFEMSLLNAVAQLNISVMSLTLDTSHFERSPLNDVARRNIKVISVTLDTSHFERPPLKDVARMNMLDMLVTLDTSHLDMAPLKEFAWANTPLMSVTLDTSHPAIGPCGPSELSPLEEILRDASTAALKSVLDKKAVVVVHTVRDIDPEESVNMLSLLAFELTQSAPQSFRLNDAA